MRTDQVEANIARIAQLVNQRTDEWGGDEVGEEVVQLAVPVVGALILAVIRIADALEAVRDDTGPSAYIRVREY